MRAKRSTICAILVAALVAGGCAQGSSVKLEAVTEPETEAVMVTETGTETEAGTEDTGYVEYVSDEDWDTMVQVYRIIMDNYETAQGLVDAGQPDPSGIVEKAGELIEYGKACGRDGLTAEEAGEKLHEMVDTADSMLNLIQQGGGEIVEIPAAEKETNAGSVDAENVNASADGVEGAESVGNHDEADAVPEKAPASDR